MTYPATTEPIICPSCKEPVELDRTLQEDSIDTYNYSVIGHNGCNAPAILRLVRRSLKAPKVKDRSISLVHPQSVKNRRNGRDAQRAVARLIGAKDIGTLGGIDLDGGWFWGEVKNTHGVPAWFKKGMAQLGMRSDRPGYLFVRNVRQGIASEVYVIETLAQWEETRGRGSYEAKT